MGKIKNPILLAINDLKEGILNLDENKCVKDSLIEYLTNIKKYYAIDSRICSLCYPLHIYPENCNKKQKDIYNNELREKLFERRKIFSSATEGKLTEN